MEFSLRRVMLEGATSAVGGHGRKGAGRKTVRYEIEPLYGVGDGEFVRTMGNLLGPPLVGGNRVTTLRNGTEIFPAMLKAIRGAERTLNFETFIYWRGEIGKEFADAFAERARAGVAVHVIIDWLGADRIDDEYIERMEEAGVRVVRYHKLRWYKVGSAARINNRTHRKLLVVDGRVGFTGGVGVADEWAGKPDSPEKFRDNHYMVEGPVVAQLQAAFMDNWMKSTGEVLHGDDYFPALEEVGTQPGQVFKSSSEGGSESMQLLYLLSVAAAREHVRLATAYFVPDRLTIDSLVGARERGVKVEILVPGRNIDIKVVRAASRARWGELLKAGVEIYEYAPAMLHVKQAIFDEKWVSIGSSNLDNRSFRLNDEANLNVLDEGFAREQIGIFEEDKRAAKRVTYEEWSRRPVGKKVKERLASMIGSEL